MPNIDRMRSLTEQETEGIRSEEGLKTAFEVADDYHIEPWRVRTIWTAGASEDEREYGEDYDATDYYD